MTVTCKCHKVVCITCRYPEDHKCIFDYHQEEKQKLTKENPTVVAEKLEKIQ